MANGLWLCFNIQNRKAFRSDLAQRHRWLLVKILTALGILALGVLSVPLGAGTPPPERITVSGNEFRVCNNTQRIWMGGANTPWFLWNDFGNAAFNVNTWDSHYQTLIANKINSSRVWITCSGEVGINISAAGLVGTGTPGSGGTAKHWADLDAFFAMAQARRIYVKATLMSFDHFKSTYSTYTRWRNWINSPANVDSYINTYLLEFLDRYGDNPYLWSIDLANEPEWASESENTGDCAQYGCIQWARFQYAWGKMAKAIHDWNAGNGHGPLVTVGMGFVKHNGPRAGGSNKVSDAILTGPAAGNAANAKLDYWDVHYYLWQQGSVGNPFTQTPNTFFGFSLDRPAMLGENPNDGGSDSDPPSSVDGPRTLLNDINDAYANGWQGMAPWTSNNAGSGNFGDWDNDINDATVPFDGAHPGLLFPVCAADTATPSATASASATRSPTRTATATASRTPTATRTPTLGTTATASPSATPSASPTATGTATPSACPSVTATPSPSSTPSRSATASPSASSSATASPSASLTASATESPSPSASFSPSASPSSTVPSATPTATATAAVTATATATATATSTTTATATATATTNTTATTTATVSATASATSTELAATASPTPSLSSTSTEATVTASPTASPTPSATASTTGTRSATSAPSATPSALPADTVTVSPSASPTPSPTPSSSSVPPSSATPSPTAAPSAVAEGTLRLEALVWHPHPVRGPRAELRFKLSGPAERLRVRIYSVAWVLLDSQDLQGSWQAGWNLAPVDLSALPPGLAYLQAQAEQGPRRSLARPPTRFVRLP